MKKIVLFSLIFFVLFISFVFIGALTSHNTIISSNFQIKTLRGNKNNTTILAKNNQNNNQIILNKTEVAKHNTLTDCWMIMNNKVYDFTNYIGQHPGGASTILPYCGQDGTIAFDNQEHSDGAKSLFINYYLGNLDSSIKTSFLLKKKIDNNSSDVQPNIIKTYPGAIITKEKTKDDGQKEIKFIYNGKKYEAKVDSAGNIVKVDD